MKIRIKQLLSLCLIVAFILAQVPILINAFMFEFSSKYILTLDEATEKNFDCVMVLGAGAHGGVPSHILTERLEKGIEVYNTNCTNRILMTGDHGREDYDEVNVMKNYAVDKGVYKNDVFMDHAGFSTYESMYRAKNIFEVETLIIITQEFHIYRAIYIARNLGLDAYGVMTDELYTFSVPFNLRNDVREFLARVKDFFYCIIKPEPTYLGEAIPISGSGELTDDLV